MSILSFPGTIARAGMEHGHGHGIVGMQMQHEEGEQGNY